MPARHARLLSDAATAAVDGLSEMDSGELAFIIGGCICLLLLLKTCFSMCHAIISPTADDGAVAPAGAPTETKLLSDIESGRPPRSSRPPKLTHAKPGSKRQQQKRSVEPPLQPLVSPPSP